MTAFFYLFFIADFFWCLRRSGFVVGARENGLGAHPNFLYAGKTLTSERHTGHSWGGQTEHYTYTHTHTHTHAHTRTHTHTHTHTQVHNHIHTYTHTTHAQTHTDL